MDKNRSKDFRYVFANAFSVRLSDNEVALTFGLNEGDPEKVEIFEEVAVVMTPRTLKIVLNNLGNALTAMETQFGEVSVPPEKLSSSFEEMKNKGFATVQIGGKKAVIEQKK